MRKSFNKKLYDLNNKKGIINAIDLFKIQFGWVHVENDKEMFKKGDVVFKDYEDQIYIVEVEVKNVGWKPDGKFKYDTLHFAYKPKTKSDYFVSFNGKCDRAFVCEKDDLIKDENIIFKNTRNRVSGEQTYNEPFYEIHLSMCEFYYKKDDSWYQGE